MAKLKAQSKNDNRKNKMSTKPNPSPPNLIHFEITPEYVKKREFGGFLANWAPNKLPHGAALRPLLNRFVFHFKGFTEDQGQLCTIPEVRAFCQSFFEAWPFWFFAGNLDTPHLLFMVFACLRKLQIVEQESKEFCKVNMDAEELNEFVQRGLCAMACLCKRAGMTESEITLRSMQVLEYFQTDWSGRSPHLPGGEAEPGRWN